MHGFLLALRFILLDIRCSYLNYLCLHFLPLLQVQAVLVSFLVTVELLQLLRQCGSTFASLLLQTVILFYLEGNDKVLVIHNRDKKTNLLSYPNKIFLK